MLGTCHGFTEARLSNFKFVTFVELKNDIYFYDQYVAVLLLLDDVDYVYLMHAKLIVALSLAAHCRPTRG